MSVERFYLNAELTEKAKVCIEGTEYHHAVRVLRLSVGESIELFNGQGTLAIAEITHIDKKAIHLCIQKASHESPLSYRIAMGVPLMRPSKLEWVVEKGTELGADEFIFYPADYSEKESLSPHQLERLRAIVISAAKQSDRLYLPSIESVSHLSDILQKEALFFFGDISSNAPYFQRPKADRAIFITGPEKGFSQKELLDLKSKGHGVKLNPHILRAETAPLAALTLFFASS